MDERALRIQSLPEENPSSDEFADEVGLIAKFLLDRSLVPVEIVELLIARCFVAELEFRFSGTNSGEARDELTRSF